MARKKKRIWLILAALMLFGIGLWLAREPILDSIGRFLIVSDTMEKSDAIVVLAGHAVLRASLAAQLYKQGWAPRILISLGDPGYESAELREFGICALDEREATEQVLKRSGVLPSDIEILDGVNSTTRLEAENALAQARRRGWKSLVVATCNYHTRRSRLLFHRLFRGSGIRVHFAAGPPEWEFNPDGWWRRRLESKMLFWEYQKLIFYAVSYW